MYGVTFGDKHSYDDYDLILTEYDTGIPAPKRNLIDVPGRNGILDLTEILTPSLTYENRQLQFVFVGKKDPEDFEVAAQEIWNDLHGKDLQVIIDTDPDHYYEGFVEIGAITFSERQKMMVTVTVDAYPYKLAVEETELTLTGSGTVNCTNDSMPVIPEFENTAEAQIIFNDIHATLAPGTHKVMNIVLEKGSNQIEIATSGTTEIRYRQGRL